MSLMQQKPPRAASISIIFKREWQRLEDMSVTTLLLLALPSLLIFCYSPLVPPLAYLLQLWSAPSNSWRDRWRSITIWRRQIAWWFVFLALCLTGDRAHFWIIPDLITHVQTLWQNILPGQLTLSPVEVRAGLLAKTILMLPAIPWLASYYERIDPRAQRRPPRTLTAEDLIPAQPKPAPPAKPNNANATQAAPSEPPANVQATKQPARTTTKKAAQQKPLHRKQSPTPTAQQLTIESYLTPEPPTSAPPAKATPQPPPAPAKPEQKPAWNWDDVRE